MGMEMERHNWEYLSNSTRYSFLGTYSDLENEMKLVYIQINWFRDISVSLNFCPQIINARIEKLVLKVFI